MFDSLGVCRDCAITTIKLKSTKLTSLAVRLVCGNYVGVVSLKWAWPKISHMIIYLSTPPLPLEVLDPPLINQCPMTMMFTSLVPSPIPSFSMLHAEKREAGNRAGHEAVYFLLIYQTHTLALWGI